jgi:hypothetical protein
LISLIAGRASMMGPMLTTRRRRHAEEGAMDLNEYALEHLVRERLADMRRQAARRSLSLRPRPRPSLRRQAGLLLIALGHGLAGSCAPTVSREPSRG